MALATILETLDDVPEALHAEYREQDIPNVGKRFVLDLTGVDTHPAVRNLKTAHDRVKADKARLQNDLDAVQARVAGLPDDFDPDEYQRLKDAAADGKGPKADERLTRQREELERKHQADLAKKDERLNTVEGALRRRTVDDGLTSALVEAGIDRKHLPLVKAFLAPQVKVVEQDGEFSASVETDINPTMPVSEFVKGWAGSDAGKIYVAPATGGGATGGSGKMAGDNPFSAQNWDVTKQGAVVREKGEDFARRLAQAAGTTLGGPKPSPRPNAA